MTPSPAFLPTSPTLRARRPLRPRSPSAPHGPVGSGTPECATRLPRTTPSRKPTLPSFRTRNPPRRWHPPHTTNPPLRRVHAALAEWAAQTQSPPHTLPSESHLRRCEVARQLGLHRLIVLAGGHRAVAAALALRPLQSAHAVRKTAELAHLADWLEAVCVGQGLPCPAVAFPCKRDIRRMDPRLGNRIAEFPGRNGYNMLAAYVKQKAVRVELPSMPGAQAVASTTPRDWRVWTDPQKTREYLSAYQVHPQVLPRLCSLPPVIASAIQRQGGAAVFAKRHRMVLDKDWLNVSRLATLVRWLVDNSVLAPAQRSVGPMDPDAYMSIVRGEFECPPTFPSSEVILQADRGAEIKRYGGRKGLSLRLGYDRTQALRDVFMGNFSVTFAADLLEYACKQVYVSSDGSVAMPTVESMAANGRHDLVAAVKFFGGEVEIGRRIGLVPVNLGSVEPEL